MESRKAYVDECREFVKKYLSENKVIVKYYRQDDKSKMLKVKVKVTTKTGKIVEREYYKPSSEKVGVMIAESGEFGITYGFSLCNTNLEPFNRWIGIRKALETKGQKPWPHSMRVEAEQFRQRTKSYFEKGRRNVSQT